MAEALYNASPVFRMSFDKCNHLLKKMYRISIKETLWTLKDSEELSRTLFSQTSIFCVEYCLLKLWDSWGVKPDYVLGHSLGEFAAAVAAGILTLKGALNLVAERSRLIDALPQGKMIVIKADKMTVDKILNEFTSKNARIWLDYAALNSCEQTVLAGDTETVNEFAKFLEAKNLKYVILAASHAFHSRHMDPMLGAYKHIASKVRPGNYQDVSCEYISGVEGNLVEKEHLLQPEYWARHTREKVNFIEACKTAHFEGCTFFLEVGPHPVLSALAMANIDGPGMNFFASLRRGRDDWATIFESVGKLYLSDWNGSIKWKGLDEYLPRKKLSLPFYQFNRKKIWADIKPIPIKLHPLLGGSMENASSITVFENDLTLKQAPYLNDHVIGSSVVFPGAAFLEMLLAGGYSHVQCLADEFIMPRRPITLKDMRIETPLGMEDSKATTMQVIVDIHEENTESGTTSTGYKTKVFHWHKTEEGTAGHWVTHASALYLPIVTDDAILNMETVNVKEIQENWEESSISSDLYKKLPEVGLRFGSSFQSLEGGWRKGLGLSEENTEGNAHKVSADDKLLVAVKVPHDLENYLAHPVLVDAMIQVSMLWSSSNDRIHKRLHVPVSIREFTWLRTTESPSRYVYCCKDKMNNVRINLLDGNGHPLMTMSGIDFVETSASVVESMIQQQSSKIPTLWEETWRHRPGPLETRISYGRVEEEAIFAHDELARAYELNELEPDVLSVFNHLDGITVVHFLNTLYELGWNPKQGEKFTIQDLMSELDISEPFKNFTQFFVKCLAQQEKLGRDETAKNTFVVKSLPTKKEISEQLRNTVTDSEASRADFKTIYEIGGKLKDILQGRIPPLAVLFPEGRGMQLADAVYEILHGVVSRSSDILLNSIVSRYMREVSELQNKDGKCRILEVGAGTGMHTGLFLGILEKSGLPYEYHYTDISAVFFNKAEEKFQKYKSHLKFKKFNIEEDPLAQGFSPNYYDMVIAAEVLHSTRHIRETLSNLRLLLRDGGSINILETTTQDRRMTFIFGLLEGYWRFQDYDLRPDHATLSPDLWEDVLNSSGFEKAVAVPCYNSVHSTIFALACDNYYQNGMFKRISAVPSVCKPTWLIFGDDSALCHTLRARLDSLDREVKYLSRKEFLGKVTDKSFIEELVGSCEANKKEGKKLDGIIYLWGIVDEDEHDQAAFAKPFLYLCQYLWDNQKTAMRTFTITRGKFNVDDTMYLNPFPSTLIGMSKVLKSEASLPVKCIDLPSNKSVDEQIEQIFYELWNHEDIEDLIAFRGDKNKRFSPRLVAFKSTNENLNLPKGSDRFQLIFPETRVISDLQFGFLNCFNLGEYEVEVKIKAVALNFRDVFAVIKPDPQFEKVNSVGLDVAGVVTGLGSKVSKWKVGDAVFGCNMSEHQALPSHFKVNEDNLIPIPDNFTFAQAATLPAVFSTSFYCLVNLAKIESSDTVLIHTGSGGVGLSAIQIAKHFGAKIIATAGSEKKRAYLRALGIQHVFHSRNTDYGNEILKATNGKGVNIVLNSLTGPGFKEATLNACAKGARFIEMSKLSVWEPEEVRALRPDIAYTIVDLSALEEEKWRDIYQEMREFVKTGAVKPIPYVRFDGVNIRAALSYLQKAKHIGKIVCIMPEIKLTDAQLTTTTPLFNDRSTYIITGGVTGGIGLETAKYMLAQGAKYLILVGRSKPHKKAEELLQLWKTNGYHVEAWSTDVGDYEQCKALIDRIKSPSSGFPPIRGVMHAAGTLSDGLLPNQTWEKFEYTFNAKVSGSWNMHLLTLDCQLEHFVLFSSMAALLGSPGQANHSAGNSFEDSLAHYRNSIGLPGTTINWGPWGQVGVATDVDIPGFRPLSNMQGLMSLDYLLRTNRIQTGVWTVDSFSLLSKFIPGIENYIDDRNLFAEIKGPVFNLNSDEFWNDVDNAEEREEKEQVFRRYIKIMVRAILKLDPEETIDDNVEFQSLGVDILMMLEMKNNLQNLFGSRMTVTASDLKGCNTTHLLANKLVDILLSTSAADEVTLSLEELKVLVLEDSKLPKHITPTGEGVRCPSQIKTVLVTGGTGMLAPYIIYQISKMPQITRIICMIRKRGKTSAEERFQSILQANGLYKNMVMDKIECIEGDVGQPRMGLTEGLYEVLSESIDCVIHCAAKVDHLQTYRRTAPQEKFHTRTSNVLGTKHVLEFATSKRTKMLFHAGTFAMIYSHDKEKGGLSEDWEEIQNFEKIPLNNGYVLSKYVAEQLVKQAVERNIPCKCFRFPFISGDSKTGWHDIRGNHTMLRLLTYMKVGAMPSIPFPLIILPVDYCAEVTVKLFFDERTPYEVYNILPKNPELEQEFPQIAKEFNYEVEVLAEYKDFLDKIKQMGENSPIHSFMDIYKDNETVEKFSTGPAIPSIDLFISEGSDKFFHSEKLQKFCPELYSMVESPLRSIHRDLQYLKDNGIFEKFGL